jgi:hypothetical protein
MHTRVDPDAKRELLRLIFESVWLDDGRIVAVRPKDAFAPFFLGHQNKTAGKAVFKGRERRGVDPCLYATAYRDPALMRRRWEVQARDRV